jgi:GNAT superfamily N-acetyltransferase
VPEATSPAVTVRPRTDVDLDACERVAAVIHRTDGYPVFGFEDLRGFLTLPDALGLWVAESHGTVVGHVALRPRTEVDSITQMAASYLGRSPDRVSVVTRLLVSPTARRSGVGAILLGTAVQVGMDLDRWPILAVDDGSAAVAFYERCGWRRVGPVTVRTPTGLDVPQIVYVAP